MIIRIAVIWLLFCALAGCSSIPKDYPRPVSTALPDTTDTRLGQRAQELAKNHDGESGYYLISDGIESLAARLQLIQASERSIDVQCFFILRDVVGRMFVNELLKAADRGVRVRLLLDDIHTSGYGEGLKTLDSHPNVEIRLFNPFAHRSLRERGIRVVVVTNSLASNDVVPVHTGYARYRNDLLEMGVFFDSPELAVAGSAAQHIDSRLPNVAYRVDLDEEGDLRWSDFTRQPAVIHTKEPDAGFWLRFKASFYRFIPIEGQL